jgi:hypothetical protein
VKTEEKHWRLHKMMYTTTLETYEQFTNEYMSAEQLVLPIERKLPALPFPNKYVLSVFVDLSSALQAAYALSEAGFDKREIHILQSHEFVKSVSQDQSPFQIITSMDHDIYIREAYRGR